jgi:hypothetical protein
VATYGSTIIVNNLFDANVSQREGGAMHVSVSDTRVSSAGARVVNNTFTKNQSQEDGGAVSVFQIDNVTPFIFSNNAVLGNIGAEGRSLYVNNDVNDDFVPAPVTIQHSAFDGLGSIFVALGDAAGTNNIEITEAAYENFATGDYIPSLGSPLIDAGALGEDVPEVDILGNARRSAPDIGAFER